MDVFNGSLGSAGSPGHRLQTKLDEGELVASLKAICDYYCTEQTLDSATVEGT